MVELILPSKARAHLREAKFEILRLFFISQLVFSFLLIATWSFKAPIMANVQGRVDSLGTLPYICRCWFRNSHSGLSSYTTVTPSISPRLPFSRFVYVKKKTKEWYNLFLLLVLKCYVTRKSRVQVVESISYKSNREIHKSNGKVTSADLQWIH